MRRASKRDRNEPEIRKRAEALGFLWLENNASTKGRPDACLLRNGQTYWCEVKEPGASYTPAQAEEFPRLIAKGVPVYALTSVLDVECLSEGLLRPWAPSDALVVRNAKGRQKTKRAHRPGYDRALSVVDLCCTDCCPRSSKPGGMYCFTCAPEAPRERATAENDPLPAPRKGTSGGSAKPSAMASHDWRGGSDKQWCGNVGCSWMRLPSGIEGDGRIRYQRAAGEKPILKAHPCPGARAS